MVRRIFCLLAVLAIAGVSSAIPNPAAVYCIAQGYEYEIRGQYGVCIFPDGSECGEWQYYCNCEPGGFCSPTGNYSCHWPCEELPCKGAGEHVLVSECCEGLIRIPPTYIYDDECNDNGMTGWTYICSDCGNGICESWESRCNCLEDCSNCWDIDDDEVNDCADNCPLVYNPCQDDSDGDGIGNFCDEDCPNLDGLNPVNLIDFSILAHDWQQTGPELTADLDGNGFVDINDLEILAVYWLSGCN